MGHSLLRNKAATRRRDVLLFSVILVVIMILYGYGWYIGRPDRQVDIYPAWVVTRELLAHGTNPYSSEALRVIQQGEMGSPSYWQHLYEVGFVYPMPLLVLLLPLSILPLKLAYTTWIVLVQAMAMASVFLLAAACRRHLNGAQVLLLTVLSVFIFEPNFEAAFWAQFSVVGLFSAALVYWSLVNNHPSLAGVALALGLVRPQSTPLLVCWLLVWALWTKKWRFLVAFVASCSVMLLASEALVPGWIWDYLRVVPRWEGITAHVSPVSYLLNGYAAWVAVATLLLLLGVVCWQGRNAGPGSTPFDQAFGASIVVGLLLFLQSSTYAFAPLLVPLVLCWWRAPERLARLLAVAGLFVLPWGVQVARAVFGSAGEADWHLLPLPFYALFVWAVSSRAGQLPATLFAAVGHIKSKVT